MTFNVPTKEDSREPLSEERFWQTQGKVVHCTVEKIALGRDVVYGIRSDLALTDQTRGGR